jgi:hypothetical protein
VLAALSICDAYHVIMSDARKTLTDLQILVQVRAIRLEPGSCRMKWRVTSDGVERQVIRGNEMRRVIGVEDVSHVTLVSETSIVLA